MGDCVYTYAFKNVLWVGNLALWLRALDTLAEDLGLVPKTYLEAHKHL